jgi:hypothetical protein
MTTYPDSQHALYLTEVASFVAATPVGSDTWQHIAAEAPVTIVTEPSRDTALEANAQGIDSLPVTTGKRRSSFSATVKAWTGNKARGNAEAATSCHLQKVLESYFNAAAVNTFAGVQVAAGVHTTTVIILDDSANIAVDDLVMINGEVRLVTVNNTGTDTITVSPALSSAPAENDWVYGAFLFTPTLGAYAKHLWAQTEKGEGDAMAGPGKVTSLSLAGTAGEIAKWTWGWAGLAQQAGVTIASPVANPFIYQPVAGLGGEALVDSVARCFGDYSVQFGMQHDELTCGTNTTFPQGLSGWSVSKLGASGSFNAYHDADYWLRHNDGAGVPLRLVHWAGGAASALAKARGAIVIEVANAQLTVTRNPLNNHVGVSVAWTAGPLTEAQLAAGRTAPFRVGVFGGVS